jgi:hypothetical protein
VDDDIPGVQLGAHEVLSSFIYYNSLQVSGTADCKFGEARHSMLRSRPKSVHSTEQPREISGNDILGHHVREAARSMRRFGDVFAPTCIAY